MNMKSRPIRAAERAEHERAKRKIVPELLVARADCRLA